MLYAIFFNSSGPVVQVPCPSGHTVTGRFYKNSVLKNFLIVLGFNDTSTLEGHFVSSPREREKRDRRDSRGDEREG